MNLIGLCIIIAALNVVRLSTYPAIAIYIMLWFLSALASRLLNTQCYFSSLKRDYLNLKSSSPSIWSILVLSALNVLSIDYMIAETSIKTYNQS